MSMSVEKDNRYRWSRCWRNRSTKRKTLCRH